VAQERLRLAAVEGQQCVAVVIDGQVRMVLRARTGRGDEPVTPRTTRRVEPAASRTPPIDGLDPYGPVNATNALPSSAIPIEAERSDRPFGCV
jgi:hypothetical protein